MNGVIYIGTSGWNYKHWRGVIYPARFASSKWLGFITTQFDSVEVNTSFYRTPKAETILKWQRETPTHIRFALKLWRGITHYKKLKNSSAYVQAFLDVAAHLELDRRAPLLIQLPPNQGKDLDKLKSFLEDLRGLTTPAWDVAMEFRNAAWLADDVYGTLDSLGVGICLHDMLGNAPTDTPNDCRFVYVRRHGSGAGKYQGSYSSDQLAADARRLEAWAAAGKTAYIYYNNDIGGHAYYNAMELKTKISPEFLPAVSADNGENGPDTIHRTPPAL
ncbi:MAG TPA: DUF72 domain-containing protein [Bryobacteraceae bacterium]|nr:DUF72 domain-containing protein [Bryobacteraceae bacterium]